MSSEFNKFLLEELASQQKNAMVGGPFGSNLVSKDYQDDGVPVIRGQNMGGRWVSGKFAFVSELKAEKLLANTALPGDLIFTQRGTLGQVSIVPKGPYKKYIVSQSQMKITVNPELADVNFLYYYFSAPEQVDYVKTNAIQTGVPHTNLGILRKTPVMLPSLSDQKVIAKVLSGLDDKIELNHRINQTLEQMAQALFKSWFVDFEPVKAKIAARKHWQALQPENESVSPVCYAAEFDESPAVGDLESYMNRAAMQAIAGKTAAQLDALRAEDPERYHELYETAALFPSAMQDSELGEIPEGWELSTVGKEFDVTMGQSPPGDTYNETGEGLPFFQGRRDFGERFPSNRVYCTQPKRMARRDDTLLSVRAPVGDTNIALTDCCIGRGLAAIKHKSGCSSFTYYSVIQLGHALSSYDSEGTVFGSINQKNLKGISQLVPPHGVLSSFQKTAKALDELIRVNSNEVASLAAMRDSLLPKLLSGELMPSEAEETHAEATA